jgi:protein-S-isoprenylcysteine O-methyltransferase Ste14
MQDHPGIRVHPPLVLLITLLTSSVVSLLVPAPLSRKRWFRLAGLPLVFAGLGLGASALRQMRRAGTNVDPHQPSTALVTGGPYRFTRNPIYLGFTLAYTGLGLLANSLWFLPFAAALMAILQTQVIRFEEMYLEDKFGPQYTGYKENVRRWI